MSQLAQRKKNIRVYLYTVVYQSRSNEGVWRDGESHIEIFLIAFPKLGAGTDICYTSVIEIKNTSAFLDSVLFFKCTLLSWSIGFYSTWNGGRRALGIHHKLPGKTANGMSGKMTLLVWVLVHLSLYISLWWPHSCLVIFTPFRNM